MVELLRMYSDPVRKACAFVNRYGASASVEHLAILRLRSKEHRDAYTSMRSLIQRTSRSPYLACTAFELDWVMCSRHTNTFV
jgi:hypothetical protein